MAALSRGKKASRPSVLSQSLQESLKRRTESNKRPTRQRSPREEAKYWCVTGLDQGGLTKKFVSRSIGYGVFAEKRSTFQKGNFLLEYVGDRITTEDAEKRERAYERRQKKYTRCYMYTFKYAGRTHWVDATNTIGHICQYANDAAPDSQACNSKMKLDIVNDYPRLCLYATRDIEPGEEIRYDYGDLLDNLSWRVKVSSFNENIWQFVRLSAIKNLSIALYPPVSLSIHSDRCRVQTYAIWREGMKVMSSLNGGAGQGPRCGQFEDYIVAAMRSISRILSGKFLNIFMPSEPATQMCASSCSAVQDLENMGEKNSEDDSLLASEPSEPATQMCASSCSAVQDLENMGEKNSEDDSLLASEPSEPATQICASSCSADQDLEIMGEKISEDDSLLASEPSEPATQICASSCSAVQDLEIMGETNSEDDSLLASEPSEPATQICASSCSADQVLEIIGENNSEDGRLLASEPSEPATQMCPSSCNADQDLETMGEKNSEDDSLLASEPSEPATQICASSCSADQVLEIIGENNSEDGRLLASEPSEPATQICASSCSADQVLEIIGENNSEDGRLLASEPSEPATQMCPSSCNADQDLEIIGEKNSEGDSLLASEPSEPATQICASSCSADQDLEIMGEKNSEGHSLLASKPSEPATQICASSCSADQDLEIMGEKNSEDDSLLASEPSEPATQICASSCSADQDLEVIGENNSEGDSLLASEPSEPATQICASSCSADQDLEVIGENNSEGDSLLASEPSEPATHICASSCSADQDLEIIGENNSNVDSLLASEPSEPVTQICASSCSDDHDLEIMRQNNSEDDSLLASEIQSGKEKYPSKDDRNGHFKVCVKKLKHVRGKRLHEKKLACLFCGNLYKHRISEHLAKVHSSELEVAKALAKDGDERKQLLDILKHKGNYKHNIRVLSAREGEEGELIVARRSDAVHTFQDYLPCIYCLGFFRTRELWRHCRTCGVVKIPQEERQSTAAVIAKSRMLLNGSMQCERTGDEVTLGPLISSMKKDAVFHSVINDTLVKKFGVVLLEKLGIRRKHDITQRMRQLGRLKLEISPNDFQLMDKISAKHFDLVVENVFKLSGRKENLERITVFEKPGLALRLGHNLVKCAQLKRGLCLRQDDEISYKDANRFLELHASEWCDKVSSIALATLKTNKFNKPALLPITSDLVMLKKYMDLRIEVITAQLKKEPEIHAWRELAEVTMTKVIVFNKRRSAEAALLLRSTYDNRGNWKRSANKEIYDSLTNIEKRLFTRLDVVQSQGKQNKTVSTLLTKQMVLAIDLLNHTRKQCGMDDKNPYVFSSKGDGPLATWQILRKIATIAGCKHPELISSTRLRKYMATVAQVIDLDSSELHWLSSHLGHNISTYKEFYRRNEATLEVTKISRLLMAAEAGQLGCYSGKKLKDINPEEINIPGEDSADEDDEPDVSRDNPDTDSIDSALCGNEDGDGVCPEQKKVQSKRKPKKTIGNEDEDRVCPEQKKVQSKRKPKKTIGNEDEDRVCPEQKKVQSKRKPKKTIGNEDEDGVCPEQKKVQSKRKPKRTIDSDTDEEFEPEAYMPRKRKMLEDGSIVRCKVSKKQWSEDENVEFLKAFNTYIDRKTMPPGLVIKRASETTLRNRTIAQIRTRVHNIINKKQKQIN